MMNSTRLGALALVICMPLAAYTAPSARQDYRNAVLAKPDLRHGATLFNVCGSCHGTNGEGSADDDVPRIAGQFARAIIRQLVDYRHERRVDPQMQGIADRHVLRTPQDLADVAAYAAGLRARRPAATGRGEYLQLGAEIYASRCSSCHGEAGEGDSMTPIPRLAGQHYRYLLRQFHDALEGRRPRLMRSHERKLFDLDREALQGLADLLSREAPGYGEIRARR